MLLVHTSKDISQPDQACRMGILEKIVNGLKFILRLIWWTFVSYLSITWIMTRWIQGNNRILTITRIAWITRFLFISCLDQFCLYFPKSSNNGIARKHKWQKSETYIRNQTYKRLVWTVALISYSMAWSVGSPKFICLCISFSHYLNQQISDPFVKTNSP